MRERKRYEIAGTVQGVGFRPFVLRLASELGLTGWVLNDGFGVLIEAEGAPETLAAFQRRLQAEKPPLAVIDRLVFSDCPRQNDSGFRIRQSDTGGEITAHIPPDTAPCKNCLNELFDPADRRFRHPFISCTDCGPRYTIIENLPYDRPQTSMRDFPLCAPCEAEYQNPADRRFHAQPIACHACGPVLSLKDGAGNLIGEKEAALETAARALAKGQIVAVKGLGGFHLCCDATDETAVAQLRIRKRRPAKPLAVLFDAPETLQTHADLTDDELPLLTSNRRPIVLAAKSAAYALAPSVAPGIDRIGVMLPSTPIQSLLLEKLKRPIVATSANLSDEPVILDYESLREKLGNVFDLALDHDRPILNACDDSVLQSAAGQTVMIRRARGYAPEALRLPGRLSEATLAVGAQQKSAIALGFNDQAVLSPHIGDLHTIDSIEYFERTIDTFKRLYRFEPKRIVCDLHPGYASSQWAKASGLPLTSVQHHHAHALAVMVEYGLRGPVLAIAWDGTGYGSDGTLWGGEFLIADYTGFERLAHLMPFGLIGGEAAVRDPKRIAYALLQAARIDHPLLNDPQNQSWGQMLSRRLNTPLSSSMGRLFDGVAALSGIQPVLEYEGQSGLRLEHLFDPAEKESYPFAVETGAIDWRPMIAPLLRDAPAVAASRFMNTLCRMATEIAKPLELPIVLCGGVFQNKTLATLLHRELRAAGKTVFLPGRYPPNDGSIALGQLSYHLDINSV
ncbi:MAG: carbamoyltransferase HypF [Campylobacterales bacterium]